MALIATPGAADANAYATLAQANSYAADRVGGAAFTALSDAQKEQAIITAAGDIDTIGDRFIGDRSSDTQSMEWPRDGSATLPTNLVKANIEYAMSFVPAFAAGYTGDVLNPSRTDGLVKRRKVDVLETEWFEARTTEATALERFPDVVQRLLASLVEPEPSGWGTGPAITRGS